MEYESPFRLGITVALSLPSPASDKTWGGVAGVKKLFGENAFGKIGEFEKIRLRNIVRNFLTNSFPYCVIAFQKDAYELLRSEKSPGYSLKQARELALIGLVSNGLEAVPLVGLPPTRYALADYYGDLLVRLKEKILSGSNNSF